MKESYAKNNSVFERYLPCLHSDGVSVATINGGKLTLTVTGETGEGDGIDSNGWIVINGGKAHR